MPDNHSSVINSLSELFILSSGSFCAIFYIIFFVVNPVLHNLRSQVAKIYSIIDHRKYLRPLVGTVLYYYISQELKTEIDAASV